MLAAVLLDLDDTLIPRTQSLRAALCAELESEIVVDRLMALDAGGYGNRADFLAEWSAASGEARDCTSPGKAIAEHLRPDEALLAELSRLRDRLFVAIVTNGSSFTQRRKLRASGLDTVVPEDHTWISEELGMKKPQPEIFRHACAQLRVEPSRCLHLGDQLEIDVQGAREAGLQARLVRSPLDAAALRALREELR
ncbi:MAG: HAD family hydrolase [Acidobacteriota bacterium]